MQYSGVENKGIITTYQETNKGLRCNVVNVFHSIRRCRSIRQGQNYNKYGQQNYPYYERFLTDRWIRAIPIYGECL